MASFHLWTSTASDLSAYWKGLGLCTPLGFLWKAIQAFSKAFPCRPFQVPPTSNSIVQDGSKEVGVNPLAEKNVHSLHSHVAAETLHGQTMGLPNVQHGTTHDSLTFPNPLIFLGHTQKSFHNHIPSMGSDWPSGGVSIHLNKTHDPLECWKYCLSRPYCARAGLLFKNRPEIFSKTSPSGPWVGFQGLQGSISAISKLASRSQAWCNFLEKLQEACAAWKMKFLPACSPSSTPWNCHGCGIPHHLHGASKVPPFFSMCAFPNTLGALPTCHLSPSAHQSRTFPSSLWRSRRLFQRIQDNAPPDGQIAGVARTLLPNLPFPKKF